LRHAATLGAIASRVARALRLIAYGFRA
jgi:hypothetical protein